MIRSVFVCAIALLLLGACSAPKRTGPPAPIVSAPPPGQANPLGPTGTEPEEPAEAVSVYPYEEPSTIAEASPGDAAAAPAPGEPQAREQVPPSEAAPSPGGEVGGAGQVAYAPDRAQTPELSPAAAGLLQQAEQQRQSRDYPGAAASLERALRISPQSAYLWNRLARVRLEQGLFGQAENLAARSNALAGDEPGLKQDNWAVIAVARRRTGDPTGAAEAERLSRGG